MNIEVSQSVLGSFGTQATGTSGNPGKVQESQSVGARRSESSTGTLIPVDNGATAAADADSVDEKQLEEMVDGLNEYAQTVVRRKLQFSVDDDSGKVVVKVIDADTKKTIREIPPEEIRNMQNQLKEATLVLFNATV